MDFDLLRELRTRNGESNRTNVPKKVLPVFINVLSQKNFGEVRRMAIFLLIFCFFLTTGIFFSALYPPSYLHSKKQVESWTPLLLARLPPFVNLCILLMAVVSVTFNLVFSQMFSVASQALVSGSQHSLSHEKDSPAAFNNQNLEISLSAPSRFFPTHLVVLPYTVYFFQLVGLLSIWVLLVGCKNDVWRKILSVGGPTLYFFSTFVDALLSYCATEKGEKLIQDNKNMVLAHSIFCVISFWYPFIRRELSFVKRNMEHSAVDVMLKRRKEIMELRRMRAPKVLPKEQ